MDIAKVRELTDTELYTELATQRRHLYDLRFQLATRQLDDHSQLTQTRRSIARILTVMTERDLDERAVVKAPQPAPSRRGHHDPRDFGRPAHAHLVIVTLPCTYCLGDVAGSSFRYLSSVRCI